MSPIDDSLELNFTLAFDAWLLKLRDRRAVSRITSRPDRLAEGHWGDAKSVGSGVIELRIDHGPGYRLYATKIGRRVVLMLAGGDKSSQNRDIAAAQILAKEYQDAS
jgi:putative addiction module killer protein